MKKFHINTRRLVTLALMAALSTGLHYVESIIPSLLPIPGFRLGLANIITLFVLYYYGGLSYLFVTAIKVLLVALISSGFGVTFLMSLTGSVLSAVISLFLY
ncbi:MAG: Gx transporter family protein, partial [bacterium]|nr:Gx transporter family protein [bacterium]